MKYQKATNRDAEAIGYLMACEGASKEEAIAKTMEHKMLDQLIHTVGTRKCKTEGHSYIDTGSYAGPEGAAEQLECRRCGWSFDHIYF
jgi:hypothetical protein